MNCTEHPLKIRYADKKAVVSALNRRLRSKRGPAAGLKYYRCASCDGWHLAKREELNWKRTRHEQGERKARKHSRREHLPARLMEGTDDAE